VDGTEPRAAKHEQGSEAAERDDRSERELPPGEGRAGPEINADHRGERPSVAKRERPVENRARFAGGEKTVTDH
jgi:hypothetical protein